MRKKIIITSLFLGVVFLALVAFKYDNKSNSINVSGTGEISFEPDIAFVTVGRSSVFKDVAKGQKEVNESVNLFVKKAKEIVVEDKISTERFSINKNYEYIAGRREFSGYTIEQHLKVELEDIKLIGKIIDVAVDSGLNSVGQITFSSSKLDEYKQKALKLSLLDAKNKAELIAKTMDVGKIKLKHISEGGGMVQPLRANEYQVKALATADSSTNYQVGEMKVMAQVSVRYEF